MDFGQSCFCGVEKGIATCQILASALLVRVEVDHDARPSEFIEDDFVLAFGKPEQLVGQAVDVDSVRLRRDKVGASECRLGDLVLYETDSLVQILS